MTSPTILILAGQRLGRVDPLAARYRVDHKCLVPLLGRSLIDHVLAIVDAAFPDSPILVSINDVHALDADPGAATLMAAGRLRVTPSAPGLLESVFAAVEKMEQAEDWPLLITTGDNVLMSSGGLRDFHAYALGEGAEGAALFARKADVLAAHAEGQPRFWKFRDGEFSGCNTFWLRGREALGMAEIFRGGGQFLKFPQRFVAAFGLSNLIGFRLNLFRADQLLRRLSRRFGRRVVVKISDDGRHAIDVDNEFSHRVAERLLAATSAPAPVAIPA